MDMSGTNKKGKSPYEELKDIISQGGSDHIIKENIEKIIKENLEEQFRKDSRFLIGPLASFCMTACNSGDFRVGRKLFEIYCDEFEKFVPWIITNLALHLEGIHELSWFDMWRSMRLPGVGREFLQEITLVKKDGTRKKGTVPAKSLSLRDQKLLWEIYHRSKDDNPVLIVGETGTSKGLVAKAMHRISSRRKERFEPINCAAIPEMMLESELFGHTKGAFTGAVKAKKGILEIADKGTVFLDEIGKAPKYVHAKILKVIDEKEFRPLGSEKTVKIDVKFIVAAQPGDVQINKDIILSDLLFRLGAPDFIQMPTLRERLDEVSNLVIESSMLRILGKPNWRDDIQVGNKAMRRLLEYPYKGNYRELENILRAAIRQTQIKRRKEILPEDLEEIMGKSRVFYGTDKEVSLRVVKLKDLFEYADKKRASIIEAKMRQIKDEGRTLRSACIDEGLTYQNVRKKVVIALGKKLEDLGF